MKPITVHPLSALAGAGVLALVLLGTGVAAPQGVAQAVTTQRMFIENVLDMNSWPNPRDMVVVKQGTPYVVPAGKILVLTGLGNATNTSLTVTLNINGQTEVEMHPEIGGPYSIDTGTIRLVPPGLTASSGSTVEVTGGVGNARAWGYLADA